MASTTSSSLQPKQYFKSASGIPYQCPQPPVNYGINPIPLEAINGPSASEDCLFLNVFAPARNDRSLPVFVWIHGGGFGQGNGSYNLAEIIRTKNENFIGVSLQYRLGVFGFLLSDEVNRFGVPNADIRDQIFALQWVQSYIHLFGGNASQVTIAGESAGGSSAMFQTMAYGGTLGTSLFTSAITASPYLPMQYGYNDWVPSQSYCAFAEAAGYLSGYAFGSPTVAEPIFKRLVEKDTARLQNASAFISGSGAYGTWGFLPVTDGNFIQQLPSVQLQKKQVNGLRVLSGNNALEGPSFVPQNLTSEEDLFSWIQDVFPLFTEDDVSKAPRYYPGDNDTDNISAVNYATSGDTGATAINVNSIATGHQQRANNIYAETTVVCPSYWLAEAYTNNGREAWKYQYSVPAALHGADLPAYFGPGMPNLGPEFIHACMTIFSNFIPQDNPSISARIAAGISSSALSNTSQSMIDWPAYTSSRPYQMNLNQTGGDEYSAVGIMFNRTPLNVTQ